MHRARAHGGEESATGLVAGSEQHKERERIDAIAITVPSLSERMEQDGTSLSGGRAADAGNGPRHDE